MASLHHHDGLTIPAAMLVLGLLAGCSGDRSGAAGAADTSGTAVVTPDSAAMPVATDTTAGSSMAPAADSAKTQASAAPAPAPKAPAKVPATAAKRPAATPAPAKTMAAEAPKSAAAPAPAAEAQDTSKPATASADAPLRDDYHQAPHDTVTQAVYNGWKQFNLNCARCHGEDVSGTTIAPHLIVSLKPNGPINTKELFVQTVCAGRPAKGMPAWCSLGLELDKINDIYSYVKGRSDAKISPGRPAVKEQG